MGLISFLGFCALLLFFSERSFFEELKTLFTPHDFAKSGQNEAHHEDYVLLTGMVVSFLGNLRLIAILCQKGRR